MGYVENNLNSKETLVAKARRAWWAFIGPIISAVVFLIVAIVVPNIFIDKIREAEILSGNYMAAFESYSYVKLVCWGTFVVFGLLPVVFRLIELYCSALCVTTNRVFGKTGVLKRNTIDISLSKLDNIVIKETFWGRIFRYSTIRIKSTSADFVFPYVADVQEFKKVIMEEIERHEERARVAQAEAMAQAIRVAQATQAKDVASAINELDKK